MSQETIQKLQNEVTTLKSRVLDAQDAATDASQQLQIFATELAKSVGFEGQSLDKLLTFVAGNHKAPSTETPVSELSE